MAEKYENVTKSKKRIFINNLIGGIAWGIGATIGASVLLAVLAFLLGSLDVVPVVGNFVSQVSVFVEQQNATR